MVNSRELGPIKPISKLRARQFDREQNWKRSKFVEIGGH